MTGERIYWVAASLLPGLSPIAIKELIALAGSPEHLFGASGLVDIPSIKPALRDELNSGRVIDRAIALLEECQRQSITVVSIEEENYPYRLKECEDAPLVLYTKGYCSLNADKILAVVGTRQATPYGRDLTQKLIRDIAVDFPDTLIVSGLAYGIDIIAHQTAMEVGLPTAAVVAHGLQTIYPTPHRKYANAITACNGLLISELPLGAEPLPYRFVQRNRIVAGLCDACIVVESSEKGGSLHTAELGRDYNREVFAFPGRVGDAHSEGCNQLISNLTAGLIQSAGDLIVKMGWKTRQKGPAKTTPSLFPELSHTATQLLEYLSNKALSPQELAAYTGTSRPEVQTTLIELETMGLIEFLPGGSFRRILR
jgi:DNA processing protein